MAERKIGPSMRVDDTFGRLTVTGSPRPGKDKRGRPIWLVPCQCSCGTKIEARAELLRKGKKRSCNCLMKEMGAINGRVMQKWKHSSKRHREYVVWRNMRDRCLRSDRDSSGNYAQRGITVCDRWLSFDNFMEDMGPRPRPGLTLERLDNDGPYSPENCCWSTDHVQRRNQRRNRFVEINGQKMCVTDAAELYGLRTHTVRRRLDAGWTVEDALKRPLGWRKVWGANEKKIA